MHARACLLILVLALASGCSRRIEAPPIDPGAVAARALAEYDTNKDGFLDTRELERCPGLKMALSRFDRDKDGRFSKTELEEYFTAYQDSKVAIQNVVCRVTLDGKALVGATVVLEPEAFMGTNIKPGRGVTDNKGQARVQIEGAPAPGCNLGIYRVRISRPSGPELPARYNTQTQLGLEVAPGLPGNTVFQLTSQ
jgi:hypothetical protein